MISDPRRMKHALIFVRGDSALDAEESGKTVGGGVATTRFTIFITAREQACCKAGMLTDEL
jgi:hypothetical protein